MQTMDKIVAVIVTFNRKNLLKRCVEHLRSQSQKLTSIVIVNNGSTDGTAEWLDAQTDLTVIHQENVGGSGGFYRGIQFAYEKEFDWIWCMDDDVYPEPDCLERLLSHYDSKTGAICPLRKQQGEIFLSEVKTFNLTNPFKSLHAYELTKEDIEGKNEVSIEGFTFEGPLFKRESIKAVGMPNKDLFILYDDSDYCYRLVKAGFTVKLATDAIMNKEKFFNGDSREEQIQKSKWKLYYHIRNTVYFNRTYGKNWWVRHFRSLCVMMQYQGYVVKNILFNKKYALSDMKVFFQAYKDGVRNNLGKKDK
jgi:GT2 family glycosyltransferase